MTAQADGLGSAHANEPRGGVCPTIGLDALVEPTFAVRLFVDADADRLTELLHCAYAELGAMGLNYTAVDQDVKTTRDRVRGGRCWVVEQDSRLVGSLTMSLPPSAGLQRLSAHARPEHRAWLNQVAVSPDARGLGIAADLWQKGRRWAVDQQATSVGVDTAVPAEHLLRLYESWGFVRVDTIQWPGKTYASAVMTRPLGSKDA